MNKRYLIEDLTWWVKDSFPDSMVFDLGSEMKEEWESIKGWMVTGAKALTWEHSWHTAGNDMSTNEKELRWHNKTEPMCELSERDLCESH